MRPRQFGISRLQACAASRASGFVRFRSNPSESVGSHFGSQLPQAHAENLHEASVRGPASARVTDLDWL